MSPINKNPLLTKAEIASELRVSTSTIEKWQKSGKINFIKIGRRTLFDRENLFAKSENSSLQTA